MTKKVDESKMSGGNEERAMAARRARLRTSLSKQPPGLDLAQGELAEREEKPSRGEAVTEATIKEYGNDSNFSQAIADTGTSVSNESVIKQLEAVTLLSNIEQILNSCAGHLVSLQKTTSKQIEELKVIAETLQSHLLADEKQGLSGLMESLTAAIEPMKAIGELVPALDRLAYATESNGQLVDKASFSKEKTAVSLAEQLLAGNIDSGTFKAAFQAIFPGEDFTHLTHRLGQLLDEQQLSGESFQAAFQALQFDQFNNYPPMEKNDLTEEETSFDEERRNEALLKEEEYSRILAEKEQDLESIRQQSENQLIEYVAQCEELKAALENREDVLRDKEAELSKKISELTAKDSENQQLKAQIEELKDKTREMMTDLQRQLAKKQEEELARKDREETAKKQEEVSNQSAKTVGQNPQSGFFDFVSTGSSNNTLFNNLPLSPFPVEATNIERSETKSAHSAGDSTDTGGGWQRVDIKPVGRAAVSDNVSQVSTNDNIAIRPPSAGHSANDAQVNTQTSASFVSAAGSYGSGVRAQVFEVIVRQALAGTQWREICAVPMQSNNISPQEVEAEVKRRQALLKK